MDILWILCASMLVFVMQAGFLCLESGLVRSKNSINVSAKNISDFTISSVIFWAVGFAIMFGDSYGGIIGTDNFLFGNNASPILITTFLFQMMFCGTAATLVSGAVAERTSYFGYLIITVTISLFIYPVVGHWAWAGIISGTPISNVATTRANIITGCYQYFWSPFACKITGTIY
jgi:Amt family ammonium transporter